MRPWLAFVVVIMLAGCSSTPPSAPSPQGDAVPGRTLPEWASPDAAHLRPGDRLDPAWLLTDIQGIDEAGGTCTVGFFFQNSTHRFVSTAAHCLPGMAVGHTSRVQSEPGVIIGNATLVYSGILAMGEAVDAWTSRCSQETDFGDDPSCLNDFALLAMDDDLVRFSNPTIRLIGGPTGVADGTSRGDLILGVGRSPHRPLRAAVGDDGDVLRSVVIGSTSWSTNIRPLPYSHTGDSGGPHVDGGGRAIGLTSWLFAAPNGDPAAGRVPGASGLVNVDAALAWMAEHGGPSDIEIATSTAA